ncbi:MAG TPA: DUF4823 domain-containing protein [Stellaceae bacterium]
MHVKRLVGLMVWLALLAGCAELSGRGDMAADKPATPLDGRRVVLIALPQEEGTGGIGAQQMVALRMARAFARHAKRVDVAPGNVRDLAVLLHVARKDRAGYLALPVVSTGGERAGWHAPDRPSMRIVIFDVSTGQEIASTPLQRTSRLLDFVSDRAQSPSARLIDEYLDGLYRS